MSMPSESIRSTDSPTSSALGGAVARIGLLLLGPELARRGLAVDSSTLEAMAGAAVTIGAAGWSIWQKYQAAKANHVNNVASAQAGVPVSVAP